LRFHRQAIAEPEYTKPDRLKGLLYDRPHEWR